MTQIKPTPDVPVPTGAVVGYARVSSAHQKLDVQIDALTGAGVPSKLIYKEKLSGRSMESRPELLRMLTDLEPGDTVYCLRLDRLARSLSDLIKIGNLIAEKGAHLKVLQQPVDTTTAAGRLFYQMLGAFSQFETDLRAERQAEGIAKYREKGGTFNGRPASIDPARIMTLASEGKGPTAIADTMGISRQSVYRVARDNGIKIGKERKSA